jgi:hypothetical protein
MILVVAAFCACALDVLLLGMDSTPASDLSSDPLDVEPDALRLAREFNSDLNAHDVDGLVDLFTDADSGPTVTADRFAWLKFEIRLWALQQVAMNISVDAYNYQISDVGVTWDADIYREDWAAVGVRTLAVSNSIWVRDRKVASYMSTPRSSVDAQRLGRLWRPGSAPERSMPHTMQ